MTNEILRNENLAHTFVKYKNKRFRVSTNNRRSSAIGADNYIYSVAYSTAKAMIAEKRRIENGK